MQANQFNSNLQWPSEYIYNQDILTSLGNLFNCYIEKHSKVLVVRFDLHYPEQYTFEVRKNDISRIMQKLIQFYKRLCYDPHYFWVREQVTSQYPHFHCILFLDGQKTQNCHGVFHHTERLWGSTIGVPAQGLVNHCTVGRDGTPHENGINLRKCDDNYNERVGQVLQQISYPAKAKGKCPPNDGYRNFGMSRLVNSSI